MTQFATNLNTMLDEPSGRGDRPRDTADGRAPTGRRADDADAGAEAAARAAPPASRRAPQRRSPAHRRCARSTARRPSRSSCPTSPARAILKRAAAARRRPRAAVRSSCCAACASDGRRSATTSPLFARCSGTTRAARSRSSCATPTARRWCCATHRCSTTARRCRRATGWSAATEVVAVSRLEAAGGVRRAEAEIDPASIADAHRRYAAERDAALPPRSHRALARPAASAAPATGVKCLHAHYAWYLAGGDDPVGAWVARRELAR